MHSLNILYYNARSILPKLDDLILSVKLHNPHVICITESWLSNDISDNELSLTGYQLFRLDRNRHGGGVLMYVSLLFSVTLHPLPPPSLDLISLSINFKNFQFCICVFYRPPSSTRCIFYGGAEKDTAAAAWPRMGRFIAAAAFKSRRGLEVPPKFEFICLTPLVPSSPSLRHKYKRARDCNV